MNITPSQLQERMDAIHAFEKMLIDSMVENRHYYIQTNMMIPRKILSKGGAEYLAKLFNWKVVLSEPRFMNTSGNNHETGQQVFIDAQVIDENNQTLAYGGGARSLAQDGFYLNTSLKMARKSAFVDAVLRASGLSGYFGQDIVETDLDQSTFSDSPNKQPNQAAAKATEATQQDAGQAVPTPAAKPSAAEKEQQEKELAEHKKALEELKQLAKGNQGSLNDLPGFFQCDSLEALTLNQIKEAKDMVRTTQEFQEKQKHDMAEQDDVDFLLV